MANEISISSKLYASKGGAAIGSHTNTSTITMTGTYMAEWTQAIGTSQEAIATPTDVTSTPSASDYYLEIKSLEATGGNYVQIALDTGITQIMCKLYPQTFFQTIVPASVAIYAKSNTADVNIICRAVQV